MNAGRETTIPDQVLTAIANKGHVVLLTHVHPDGDALGSLLGLGDVLEAMGKTVFCFMEEPVGHLFQFLPGKEKAQTSFERYLEFVSSHRDDLVIVALDCGDSDRLGCYKDEFLTVQPLVVIDHHQSHRDFGSCRWVEAHRSSTGEMVYELALALGARLSYQAAYNLYVAICTDTGTFRYECTRPRTLEIAAELLARGVKADEVSAKIHENYSPERIRLMAMVLSSMILYGDGKIALTHVSEEMLEESGATLQDVEGFVDLPRSIRSVKVAGILKQNDKGFVAVSLRAKGHCDVAAIAKAFGGGGHRNAAGFRCFGQSIDQVRRVVLEAIQAALQ